MSHLGAVPGTPRDVRCDDRGMTATRTAAALLSSALLAVLAAGCTATDVPAASPASPAPPATEHLGEQPTPDVTGVVAVDADGRPTLSQASDDYFEAMPLGTFDEEPVPVLAADGSRVTLADLRDGDRIEIWLPPVALCGESMPVQCELRTVRVAEAAEPAPSPTPAG